MCAAISCGGNTNNGVITGEPNPADARNNDINGKNATDDATTSSTSQANGRIASFLGGLSPNDIDVYEIEQTIFNLQAQQMIAVCMQQSGLEYTTYGNHIPPPGAF